MLRVEPLDGSPAHTTLLYAPDDHQGGALPSIPIFQEATDLVDSREVDPKLAFLMGSIYAGRSKELGEHYTLQLINSHPQILEVVKQDLEQYFPNSTPTMGMARGSQNRMLNVSSRSLARLFNFHTNNTEELPRHLLGTLEEKVSFLRGLFSFAGSISDQGVSIGARLGRKSALQIALLLDEVGATPVLTEVNGYLRLVITDAIGVKAFHDLRLMVDPEKSVKLEKFLESKTGRISVDPKKYYEFRDSYLEDPKKPVAQIASEIGVPETTARYWAKGNQPRAVTRTKKLKELATEAKVGEGDAIVFAYREMRYSLSSSLALAERFSANDLREIVAIGEALGIDMNASPQKILQVQGQFRELMEDIFHDTSVEDLDEKLIKEMERRGKLVDWAREQGITASHFSTLVSQILEKHLESVYPAAIKVHHQLGLERYGVDREAAKQLAAITLFDCISSGFDPAKNPSLKAYGSQAVKLKLYTEYSRVSKTGHRVVEIAKALSKDPSKHATAEQVMEDFKCKRATAVHALHLASSQSRMAEQSADFSDQEMPYAHLAGKRERNPAALVETSELFQQVMSLADKSDRAIIEAIYRDGMDPEKLSEKLKIPYEEIERRLAEFYSRAREQFG